MIVQEHPTAAETTTINNNCYNSKELNCTDFSDVLNEIRVYSNKLLLDTKFFIISPSIIYLINIERQ